ncbi:hypothetical protein EON64_10510 [archaeon]|nr:MAG: hypothetical protein EON64_10510 [archaeon]
MILRGCLYARIWRGSCNREAGKQPNRGDLCGLTVTTSERLDDGDDPGQGNRQPIVRPCFATRFSVGGRSQFIACRDVSERGQQILNPLRLPFRHSGKCLM